MMRFDKEQRLHDYRKLSSLYVSFAVYSAEKGRGDKRNLLKIIIT